MYLLGMVHVIHMELLVKRTSIEIYSVSVSVYLLYNNIIIYIKCVYIILVPCGPGGQ